MSAAVAAQAFAGLRLVWLLYGLVAGPVRRSVAVNRPARSTFFPSLLPAQSAIGRAGAEPAELPDHADRRPALAGCHRGRAAPGPAGVLSAGRDQLRGALYGVARLPAMRPRASAARPGPRAVAEGIGFIRRSQVLAGAFLADLNATVFGLPVALFPAINAERFGGNPRTLGLFTAAIGVGGLVSAAFSGAGQAHLAPGPGDAGHGRVWGAAFAGFAVAPSLWLTLGLLAVAGAADTFTVVFRGAIVQRSPPISSAAGSWPPTTSSARAAAQLGNLEAGALGS